MAELSHRGGTGQGTGCPQAAGGSWGDPAAAGGRTGKTRTQDSEVSLGNCDMHPIYLFKSEELGSAAIASLLFVFGAGRMRPSASRCKARGRAALPWTKNPPMFLNIAEELRLSSCSNSGLKRKWPLHIKQLALIATQHLFEV